MAESDKNKNKGTNEMYFHTVVHKDNSDFFHQVGTVMAY